ncbi:MAG: DUF1926 domain-containing protein [Chloroflexi bacterium]|nr:DUF1926 domain-containing protein [Chloroflexota bacterium]
MSQIYMSLIFHNHQPVGNFDFVFQEAFEKAYQPLTDCLDRHPTIKVAMHFTGPLIDWLKANQPDYLRQVAQQVKRGQLEILSGAYYEPILSMLSDVDKLGQIHKLNASVQALFGADPAGMWLAERIWEPYLAMPIRQAGIQYTVIDDALFFSTGFKEEDFFGYYVTEEQGHSLKIIPAQTKLRYMIPWRPVEEVINWLRHQATLRQQPGKPPVWAVMGDDGEKFGLWPQTYESVWGEEWMDRFFAALEANSDWLSTIHPATYINEYNARGIAYLPTASYVEMGEWALPSPDSWLLRDLRESYELRLSHIPEWDQNKREEIEQILRFLQGSFWRNFLVKYPEINHMQKRGMALSKRIHELTPSTRRDQALDALWASQCNCAYWHGVFGGVYLFHIRSANYSNIIRAETLLDEDEAVWCEETDFNADSYDEILAGNGPLAIVVEPNQGGLMTELDYRPAHYNLLNVMTRHPEGYHAQIREAASTHMLMTPEDNPNQFEGEPVRVKERGLENYIFEDWHRRGMFIEHFLGEETTLTGFEAVQYPEQGDFVNQPYVVDVDEQDTHVRISLKRDGNVWVGEMRMPVRVEKVLVMNIGEPALHAHYRLQNQHESVHLRTRFGVEIAFGFDGGDNREYCHIEADDRVFGMGERGLLNGISEYYAVSQLRNFGARFTLNRPADLWWFPLAPITLSEGGFERVHQGIVTMPCWRLELSPGEVWEFDLTISMAPLET